jgi:hypothetical protein
MILSVSVCGVLIGIMIMGIMIMEIIIVATQHQVNCTPLLVVTITIVGITIVGQHQLLTIDFKETHHTGHPARSQLIGGAHFGAPPI